MNWLKQTLTGADNSTFAIGRVLGALAVIVLVIGVPVVAVAAVWFKVLPVADWQVLLSALGIYVPLVIAAVTGLIRVTAPTEPTDKGDGK